MSKYVFFSNAKDAVSCTVAEHIGKIGYTPVFAPPKIDLSSANQVSAFLAPYSTELIGGVLANPDIIKSEIETAEDEMWNRARDIFPAAMLNMTQIIGGILTKNGCGSIIFLNSIHADKPLGNGFLYTMGCAAVQMLCREAALVYGEKNVGCFNIMRGIVEGEESNFTSEYSSLYHNSAFRFPKERIPAANSMNELCAFLLSGGAYIINGTDIHADEGFNMYYGKSTLQI